ncbi:carboxypeptidase B-like [Chelonus insularis]|uniref:carboxypeptidase B-like n=1 Tax=Chelonus insularis TaxID=460826 RepID=UPI00158D1E4C|nr:carboxypeptidase B-like [Chelonus insularis]
MAYWNILLSILVFGTLTSGELVRPLKGMQCLSIICETTSDLSFVQSYVHNINFDFLKLSNTIRDPIDVLVTAKELSTFKKTLQLRNISYIILVDNVERAVQEELNSNTYARLKSKATTGFEFPFTYYPRYAEISQYIKRVVTENSKKASLESFGKTYEGRDLYVVKISSGGSNKPIILIDAGIHAREWISPTTALYAIHQLLYNQSNAYLYQNVDWYIIPSINPDGYEYTHTSYRFWRKTRSVKNDMNCIGTDANRNFDYKWMTVGASSYPCSETYAGPKPFSEVETQALRDLVESLQGNVKVYLTLHSYGQYLLHPWGWTSALPSNEPTLRSVGLKAAQAIAQIYDTRYTVGSSTNVLYAAAGGSDDWVMAVGKADLSYTIELPGGRFDPPPSKINPIAVETFEAFKVFHEYVEKTYVRSK